MGEYAHFGEWGLAFLPVIDEATMPRHAALADADIDLMIGWTSGEASFAFGMNPQYAGATRDQVIAWASTGYGDRAATLCDIYAEASPAASPREVLTQMVTDGLFRCGGFRVAAARADSRPAHAYQFEVASPILGGALGATHCMELPFTFANIEEWGPALLYRESGPRQSTVSVARCTMPGLASSAMAIPTLGVPCPGAPTAPMTPLSWSSARTTSGLRTTCPARLSAATPEAAGHSAQSANSTRSADPDAPYRSRPASMLEWRAHRP
jgi:hypothetical protein